MASQPAKQGVKRSSRLRLIPTHARHIHPLTSPHPPPPPPPTSPAYAEEEGRRRRTAAVAAALPGSPAVASEFQPEGAAACRPLTGGPRAPIRPPVRRAKRQPRGGNGRACRTRSGRDRGESAHTIRSLRALVATRWSLAPQRCHVFHEPKPAKPKPRSQSRANMLVCSSATDASSSAASNRDTGRLDHALLPISFPPFLNISSKRRALSNDPWLGWMA